jgi:hypothetical protein
MNARNAAAIGFRAKTGRAIAVALTGSRDAPSLVWRQEVSLVDTTVPETAQPYHAVMELPWARASVDVQPYLRAIEAIARSVLLQLKNDLEARGLSVRGVVAVGSHDRVLEKIGNPHMRAHAAEGMLFRRVLELAAEGEGLPIHRISDRAVDEAAESQLGLSSHAIQAVLDELGAHAGPPWRKDQKAAAIAAWIGLVRRRNH